MSWPSSGRPASSLASFAEIGLLAGDDLLRVGGRPGGAGDRDRDLALGQIGDRRPPRRRPRSSRRRRRRGRSRRPAPPRGAPGSRAARARARPRAGGCGPSRWPSARPDRARSRCRAIAVASSLETRASSACLVRFSLRLAPEMFSMLASTPSRSPYSLQQLGGGLVADARDAGDVVGGVALEADQVGDPLGRHAVALDHALAVVDLGVGDAARGGHHPHPVLDQLVDVAVAGDDHHVDPLLAGALGEAAMTSSAS